MIELRGLPASPGIAVGKVFIYRRSDKTMQVDGKFSNVDEEISRFLEALEETKSQVRKLKEEVEREAGGEAAAIFEAHLMILEDREFVDKVTKHIREKNMPAEDAVKKGSDEVIAIFNAMESEYFRSRADDIKDLRNKILENLSGKSPRRFELEEPRIVAAPELFPSDTVKMKKQKVTGLVTEKGGVTSHAAIIARAMKIPAVVGVKGLLDNLRNGDFLILDGSKGLVIVNPEEELIKKYENSR